MIELMMVVAILAILSALAAPSMSSMIAAQRLRSVATDLHLTLVKARAEAIKRNVPVTVSPADGSWTAGWSILNPENAAWPALDVRGPTASVSVTTSVTTVVYRGNGRPATAAGAFVITSTGTAATRCLSISSSGRPYLKEGSIC
jgi:type IV fimbrial biogenesis protein FimT